MALFEYKKGPGLPPIIRELAQELAAALNGYPGSFDTATEFKFIMNAGNLLVIRVQNYPAGQWTPPPSETNTGDPERIPPALNNGMHFPGQAGS